MATQVTPYEFVPDIRRRAEELRMANVRQAVRGSIQAHSITADMMAVGVLNVGSGAVTIDSGVITGDKLAINTITATQIDVGAVGSSELGDGSVTGVKIVDGSVTAAELNVGTLSAITANMGTLTAGTINGGTIISGSGSPQATFGPDGIVLTNAQTSEAVNHAPSHVDFYSDGAADSDQKGSLACFIGPSDVNYAPHLTLRALCPAVNATGRVSISTWVGTNEKATLSVYPSGAIQARIVEIGKTATLAYRDAGGGMNGSWGDGDLYAQNFFFTPSDRTAKKKIKKLDGSLQTVRRLNPVSYELRDSGKPLVGFVADEVKATLPEAVGQAISHDPATGQPIDGASALSLTHLITHAIGAVQELATRVEALERK